MNSIHSSSRAARLAAIFLSVLFAGSGPVMAAPAPRDSSRNVQRLTSPARAFDFRRDTFAFSNDTAFAYGIDEAGQLQISRREKPPEFAHGCFLLCRAVLQFHQFARFAPELPKASREEYRERIRALFRIAPWSRGPRERIVIPGFADLRTFSKAYEGLLKENLGNWMATYLRVGNWRMSMPHPRGTQAALSRWLLQSLQQGTIRAIYLSEFPKMNHVVIVYGARTLPDRTRFTVYDPNYPAEPAYVDYMHATKTFHFPRRWYFQGGPVSVFRVYTSPIH